MKQYGARLVGARETLWFVDRSETINELLGRWAEEKRGLVEVRLVGGDAAGMMLINPTHVVAVCGPNSPRIMERLFP